MKKYEELYQINKSYTLDIQLHSLTLFYDSRFSWVHWILESEDMYD